MEFPGTNLWFNPYMYSTATDPYFGYVTLLLHFDGDLTDSSSYNQTITNAGSLTANGTPYFGTGSHNLSAGSSGYLTTQSIHWFGSNNFTIEFWVMNTYDDTTLPR